MGFTNGWNRSLLLLTYLGWVDRCCEFDRLDWKKSHALLLYSEKMFFSFFFHCLYFNHGTNPTSHIELRPQPFTKPPSPTTSSFIQRPMYLPHMPIALHPLLKRLQTNPADMRPAIPTLDMVAPFALFNRDFAPGAILHAVVVVSFPSPKFVVAVAHVRGARTWRSP